LTTRQYHDLIITIYFLADTVGGKDSSSFVVEFACISLIFVVFQ